MAAAAGLRSRTKSIVEAGTIIRAYGPRGYYWCEDLLLPTAICISLPDLIVTACHFDERRHVGEFYSEFDEPMVEEIRLLAALTLPIGIDDGMVAYYPLDVALRTTRRSALNRRNVPRQVAEQLRAAFAARPRQWMADELLPSALGGTPYKYRDGAAPIAAQRQIYEAIDPSDHLLMRGLATLMKGVMLGTHHLFREQAIYSLYVSLDASFRLVLRKLRDRGLASPSSYEAQAFIEEAFQEESSGRQYFAAYYEDRIKAMHPESRFGVFPYAPVMHDDFFWLFKALRDVYRFLILGAVIDPLAARA